MSQELEHHFDRVMKDPKVPRFSNLQTYVDSFPVREHTDTWLKLHQLPFWVRDVDLQAMAQALIHKSKQSGVIKYVASPSASGKTSSILHAFLKSTKMQGGFTHYLYIAFTNNENMQFGLLDPHIPIEAGKTCPAHAEAMGAQFMMQCVEKLLHHPQEKGPYGIAVLPPVLPLKKAKIAFRQFLKSNFVPPYKILFHVDEHRHMSASSDFRRGALAVLDSAQSVVVATYISPVIGIKDGSFPLRRDPVVLPTLDMTTLTMAVPELQMPPMPQDTIGQVMWKIVRLRLAYCLQTMGLQNVHCPARNMRVFLNQYCNCKGDLVALLAITKVSLSAGDIYQPHAAQLLLGVSDDAFETLFLDTTAKTRAERQRIGTEHPLRILPICSKTVSCDLTCLLSLSSDQVYNVGRYAMRRMLSQNADCLERTPLQIAFQWALGCRASFHKRLVFHTKVFLFSCEQVQTKTMTILPGCETDIKKHIMYYSLQENITLYFKSDVNELVFVDVTSNRNLRRKPKKMKRALSGFKNCFGIIIAPNAVGRNIVNDRVIVIRGKAACALLGGLAQVLQWIR